MVPACPAAQKDVKLNAQAVAVAELLALVAPPMLTPVNPSAKNAPPVTAAPVETDPAEEESVIAALLGAVSCPLIATPFIPLAVTDEPLTMLAPTVTASALDASEMPLLPPVPIVRTVLTRELTLIAPRPEMLNAPPLVRIASLTVTPPLPVPGLPMLAASVTFNGSPVEVMLPPALITMLLSACSVSEVVPMVGPTTVP